MKKLSLYIFLVLMWCNVGFAECIEGDCNNGYGTYTWASGEFAGDKYVGEWKDGNNMEKEFLLTNLAKNMRENLYKAYTTDKEPTPGLMEKNTLENGKMVINMDKELTHGLMEKNTLENIKMMNLTDKEFLYFQKEHIRLKN